METSDLRFQVVVSNTLPPETASAVSFRTGKTTNTGTIFAYDGVSPLPSFYEDLLLGAPFPFVFHTHEVSQVDTVVAVALYLHRELALAPGTTSFVGYADLYQRKGEPLLAHVPSDTASLLRLLRGFFPSDLPRDEVGGRVSTAVTWVREFLLEDKLPHVVRPPTFKIETYGSNGFVVAQSPKPSVEVWTELYRAGYLRGVLIGSEVKGGYSYILARKSTYLTFDLGKGLMLLNELERLHESETVWANTGLALYPMGRSSLSPAIVVDVAIRL